MLFNSFGFLVFFPLVCLGYYLIPFRFRHIFLLIASYYFYMCWNPKYALLMLTSTVITYTSGIFMGKADNMEDENRRRQWKKALVVLSFLLNLSILFFFKYFNFTVATINRLFVFLHMSPLNVGIDVVLPVGISFYTFQALSYTMDVYRGEIYYEKSFLKYALFVSFFPQLVAGPIERSKNLLKQISVKHTFKLENVQDGLTLMLFGYFQKVMISDNVAMIVNHVYNNYTSFGAIELMLATVLFAIQIYCDFGGYSNIAIGAAKVMGFELMENFNTPYLANSVMDFWRRWHISLTSWFRDYLYIPIGGNRKGRIRKYVNIMIVFLTSGLWHGASWHYVAWGGINGLYQIIGDLLKPVRNKLCAMFDVDRKSFSHQAGKVMITFALINVSWVFFRANSINDAVHILIKIFSEWNPWVLFGDDLFQLGWNGKRLLIIGVSVLILIVMDLCKYLKIDVVKGLREQGVWFQYVVYLSLIGWILVFGSYGPEYDASQFIYFQF